MFFTAEKLEARVKLLETRRFLDMEPITPMVSMEGGNGPDEAYGGAPPPIAGPEINAGDVFAGRDRYLWLSKKLRLPPAREGCDVAGLFDFGYSDDCYMVGFESMLYVDGEPYQGVGTYHKDVVFTGLEGKEADLAFLLWTGIYTSRNSDFRHRVQDARIGYLHRDADEFYFYAKAIVETVKLLADSAAEKHELTVALDYAVGAVNWDEDKFYGTVGGALALIKERLEALGKGARVTVSAVGHTHIDVAWLWRLKHTREKAMRSFSTVLKLMDEFGEYAFLQSQPQLYKYIKEDCPGMYARIKERVKEGRWEPDGGMWVEADCNIPSGEALVRQLTHGIAFFREEFGTECEFLWLPDVFGYSWSLPQILAQCGIKTFSTTKISWNEFNTFPYDLFRWRGIDGTEILTYFVTTPPENHPIDSRAVTYNGQMSPRSVLGNWGKFKNKELSNETLLCYGHGDGGGGVTRDMLKMRRAMDKLPGLPNVKPSGAGKFFRRLHEKVANADSYIPVWDGELYLETHRGTLTSQAKNKKMNRRLELDAVKCEWLCCLGALSGADYPAGPLHGIWESILLHQFHDIIPGSSIREVYRDSDAAYAETERELARLTGEALGQLTREDGGAYTLVNPGSFERRDLVRIPEAGDVVFCDDDGSRLPAQRDGDGWLVNVSTEPLSLKTITFTPGAAEPGESAFTADMGEGRLETPLYRIAWDANGRLASVFDKAADREALGRGQRGNDLEIYEDRPLAFENWNIDVFHLLKCEHARLDAPPELAECGTQRAVVRFRYSYNRSTIRQDMIVYRDTPRIDFATHVEWAEERRLLKTAFPVDIRATCAAYDIQFGHLERPTHFNTAWDLARFEVAGHKWADLSEYGYGVSLLNDCKYGYSVHDGVMRLTLLKSGKYPDPEADMGGHDFTYSLLPHAGGPGALTIGEAVKLNQKVTAIAGRLADGVKRPVKIEGGFVIIDAVKKAYREDCLVVRMHECRGSHGKAAITSDYGWKAFAPCNLLEENTQDPCPAGGAIIAEFRPFEIKTYKIWFR